MMENGITRKNKLKRFIILFVCIILIAIFCIGCTAKDKELTPESICEKCLPATLEIKVCDITNEILGMATGTIINNSGLVLTNRHVVDFIDSSGQQLFVKVYGRFYNEQDFFEMKIEKISADRDLALLSIENQKEVPYIKIGDSSKLKYGEEVHTIGNSNGFGLIYSHGYIATPLNKIVYDNASISAIQVSMNINEGNSGGPLLNNNGEMVGVITFRLRDNNADIIYGSAYALTSEDINKFLEE